MKRKNYIFYLIVLGIYGLLFYGCAAKSEPVQTEDGKPQGTAVIITGAAARIPQEAALLEQLYKTGQLKNVVFIGGASSGALNTVMLNGILTRKISWKQYVRWLENIATTDIYNSEDKKLPVDVAPLKNYLSQIVNDSLKYHKIGDLPITSAISITDLNRLKLPKTNYRLSNKKINPESDPNLDLVEILMASTAFPVVFPEEKINNATTLPDHYFVDGGLGDDRIPYHGLIDFINFRQKSVEKIIIVSRKSDLETDLSEELRTIGISDNGMLDKTGLSLDEFLYKGFIRSMISFQKEYPELAERTEVYIPDFEERFLLLDFNTLSKQYQVTKKWAQKNKPVPLKTYLIKHQL